MARNRFVVFGLLVLIGIGCAPRVKLEIPVDELGAVWVNPEVTMASEVDVDNLNTTLGILFVPLLRSIDAQQQKSVDLAVGDDQVDIAAIVHQEFVDGVRRLDLFDLHETREADNRVRLRVDDVDLVQVNYGDPALSVVLTAAMFDKSKKVIWQQTERSDAYRSDTIKMADYAHGAAVFSAVFRCVTRHATAKLLSSITKEPVRGELSCVEGVDIARAIRWAADDGWEKELLPLAGEPVSGLVTCGSPYELERDCSVWTGATRKIKLGPTVAKIAGSADGRVIFVQSPTFTSDYAANTSGRTSRAAAVAIRRRLVEEGIEVVAVREKPTFQNQTLGIFLELDADGYDILTAHSVK